MADDDFDGCGSAERLRLAQKLDNIYEYGCSTEQLTLTEQAFAAAGWVPPSAASAAPDQADNTTNETGR